MKSRREAVAGMLLRLRAMGLPHRLMMAFESVPRQNFVPVMHLEVDREKYFWFHHTDADTIDKLDVVEFNRCVAAMAVMAYVIADLPETLPR